MQQTILISFESDPSGLNVGIDALEKMGKVDGDLANNFRKTNAALLEREKTLGANKNAVSSYVDALGKVQQATVGAFAPKIIQDFKTASVSAFGAITQQIAKLQEQKKALDNSKLKSEDIKLYNIAAEKLNKELKALFDQIKLSAKENPFKPTEDGAGKAEAKVVNFRTQLRNMQQELLRMSQAGETFSVKYNQSFEQLQRSAAALQDDLGDVSARIRGLSSDSANIDAVAQGINTLSSAGQIAAGTMGLLGDENAELQETMVKLQSVMLVTSGIQQIINDLQRESILRLKLEAAYTSLVGAANTVTAGTYRILGASVESTSLAFKGMRAAIALTGIGALVIGITALISYMSKLDPVVQDADESLKGLGDTVGEIVDRVISDLTEDIKSLNDELGITPSNVERATKALELLQKQAQSISKDKGFFAFDLSAQGIKNSFIDIAAAFGLMEDRMTENQRKQSEIRQLQAQKEKLERLKAATDLLNDTVTVNRESAKEEAQLQIAKNAVILNDAKASYAARLAALQDNLKQQKIIVAADLDLTLNQTTSEPKRALAKQKADNDIIKAQIDFNSKLADLQQASADKAKEIQEKNNQALFEINQRHLQSEVDLYKSFADNDSYGYDLRLAFLKKYIATETQLLNVQRANELAKDGLTAAQRLNIVDKFNTEVQKLTVAGLAQRNVLIKGMNEAAKQENLQFYTDLATNELKLLSELFASQDAVFNELSSKNEARLINNLRAVEVAYRQGNISLEQYEIERSRIVEDYEVESLENQKSRIAALLQILEYRYRQGNLAEKDYQKQKEDLQKQGVQVEKDLLDKSAENHKKHEQKKTDDTQKEEEKRAAIRQRIIELANTVASGYFDAQRDRYQNEMQLVDELYSRKAISEKEHDARIRKIRREQAVLAQQEALFNIAISTAQAIARDLVGNKFLIPYDIAMGLAQTAFVLSKPLPKYKKGGYTGDKDVNAEVGVVHGREFVAHAAATKRHRAALEAMNQGAFEQYLQKAILSGEIKIPELSVSIPEIKMPEFVLKAPVLTMQPITDRMMQRVNPFQFSDVDIKRIAKEIGKEVTTQQGKLEDMPRPYVSVDEDGLKAFLEEKDQRTEYLNKRYKF